MTAEYIAQALCFTEGFSLASLAWERADNATLASFHPKSSDHQPRTIARLGYSPGGLVLRFDVDDRYVRCVTTELQQNVCGDSCVEFFVQPRPGKGYFNFEINCGGTLLVYYIEDPTRTAGGFRRYTKLPVTTARQVHILHSLPAVVEPEIAQPLRWSIACQIPLAVMETYVGELGSLPGQVWRGNFFKCGDKTSHPHWGSWSPIGEELNFHQPARFGVIRFL